MSTETPTNNPGLEIINARTSEVRRNSKDPSYKVQPFTDEEFREGCDHILNHVDPEKLLSKELLRKNLDHLQMIANHIETEYGQNLLHCLTVYPTSEYGNPLTPEILNRNGYLQLFVVNPENGFTSNFSGQEAKYFELLPDFIRENCCLKVPKEWSKDLQQKMQQFVDLYNSYIDAYNNLRTFLGLPPLDIPHLEQQQAA